MPLRLDAEGSLAEPHPPVFEAGQARLPNALLDAGTLAFEGASQAMRLRLGRRQIELRLTNLPNLLIWTRPNAGFLCLEPSHGLPARSGEGNALEARPFAISLPAGETASFAMAMTMTMLGTQASSIT